METKLPDIDPYFEKCGRGTAYIGSMIKDELVKISKDAAIDETERCAEIIMSYAYGDEERIHLLKTIVGAIRASNPYLVEMWGKKE